MTSETGGLGATAEINFKCLLGATLTGAALFLWPTSGEYWHSGLIAVFCGLGAFSAFAQAIHKAVAVYKKERASYEIEAQGVETHQAGFVEGKDRASFRAEDLKG